MPYGFRRSAGISRRQLRSNLIYLPSVAENVSSPRPRRRTSIPSRLIFWFSVDSGIMNRSAASVWFHAVRSSISMMMRRSISSMI